MQSFNQKRGRKLDKVFENFFRVFAKKFKNLDNFLSRFSSLAVWPDGEIKAAQIIPKVARKITTALFAELLRLSI